MRVCKIVLLCLTIFISSCANGESSTKHEIQGSVAEQIAIEDILSNDGINDFTIVSDNTVATLEFSTDENNPMNYFRKYVNNELSVNMQISSDDTCGGFSYNDIDGYYYVYRPMIKRLQRLNENFEVDKDIAELDVFEIKGIDVIGDNIYITSVKDNPYNNNIIDNENGYMDFGEKVYKINVESGNFEELNIKNPICQFYDGNTMYYYTCYNNTYELVQYCISDKTTTVISEMNDVGYIVSFIIYNNKFIYSLPGENNLNLKNLETGRISSYANNSYALKGTDLKLYKGNIVFLNRNNMHIEKIYLGNDYDSEDGDEKRFLGTELVIEGYAQANTIDFPKLQKDTGITATIYEAPTFEDEIILKIMAHDADIDIYTFTTSRSMGRNLRSNKIFVPLNDCQIISSHLSDCHDYISEYLIEENGDIWAMPIGTESDVIWYVPENISKLGLTYETNFKWYSDLLDTFSFMMEQDQYMHYGYMEDIADDEIRMSYNINYSYTEYNNQVFKTLFEKSRSGYLRYDISPYFKGFYPFDGSDFDTNKVAFKICSISNHFSNDSAFNTWRAFPLANINSEKDKNPVILRYAVINPYSTKIDAAKYYLSTIASNNAGYTKRPSLLFKNINKYIDQFDINSEAFKDAFNISCNSEIYEPIYKIDLEEYLNDYHEGKMSVDEVAEYLERRTEMAINE